MCRSGLMWRFYISETQPPPSLLCLHLSSVAIITSQWWLIATMATLLKQGGRRERRKRFAFSFWEHEPVASLIHWSELRDMAPLSFEGGWEMSSLSCALLNFSIKDGENGYWEKISSICHSGKVWVTQGLIMREVKKKKKTGSATSSTECFPSGSTEQ